MIKDRIYNQEHCWQYDIRTNNLEKDLKANNLTLAYTKGLEVKDFDFKYVDSPKEKKNLKEFIKSQEWLGTIGIYYSLVRVLSQGHIGRMYFVFCT